LILKQIEGLEFTTQHKDYFASHSVAHLPIEFVARIGELADSTHVDDISDVFYRVDNVIREAREYVCTIADQYLMSTYPLFRDALERKVKLTNIEAKSWVVSPKMKRGFYSNEKRWVTMRQTFTEARTTGLLEERMLERLDVFLYMSENEVAGVAFPLPDERFDYVGFSGKSERAHRWCKDLFEHYWRKAHPRQRLIAELCRWVKKRPEAIHVLKALSEGKRVTYGDELIPRLESMNLVRQGELTVLGDFVVAELQK
jgi:predicted transcriptional regulator